MNTDKSLPDLAVEVNYPSGSIADLEKYKDLGIEEDRKYLFTRINF
ncbi:MAG TPA: hypothetical protein ACFCUY_08795 [Xenococcaceae cyanobacterium]